MKKGVVTAALLAVFSLSFLFPKSTYAGRGCCSWHGGQSYCDTSVGRWVCADGTYSPSCGCTYIPPKPTNTPTPRPTNTPTPRPTNTPTPIPTDTPTPQPTVTNTNTPTPEAEVLGTSTNNDSSGPGALLTLGSIGLGYYGFRKLFKKKPVEIEA